MILVLSTLAGCRGWDASADWARAHFDLLRRYLDLWHTPPSADTLRRTAQAYDLDDFLGGIGAEDGTVHLDGKRVRGATRDGQVHHFVEALCGGRVIGMVEMGAGTEAPALEALVAALDLAGRLVTLDAAGTTPAVAAALRRRDADFLLAVKANQPSLLNALKRAFDESAGHAYQSKDAGHGRHETRRARTITEPTIVARVSGRPRSKTSAVCARSVAPASPRRALSRPSITISAAGACARASTPGVSGPIGALRPCTTFWTSR